MSRPLEVGSPAPRFVLPGIPGIVDSTTFLGAPCVIEFLRGTW